MMENEPSLMALRGIAKKWKRRDTGSEFGKGFAYCLGLFIAHEWFLRYEFEKMRKSDIQESTIYGIWFNGAGDHLFEFEADKAPIKIRQRCVRLKKKVLHWRLSMDVKKADKDWAIDEAKALLLKYDELQGFETCKATWS